MRFAGMVVLCALAAATVAGAQSQPVEVQASRVSVFVYRGGIFGALGDNHEILAPIAEGKLDESSRQITLRFRAAELRVLDPKLSPEQRAKIQQRMLSPDVLDVAQFPEITFRSTSIRQESGNRLLVTGNLQLHGQTHPVSGMVESFANGFRGSFRLEQHKFGIKPIKLAGGMVKVKDEVLVQFEIQPAAAQRPNK